MAEYAFDNRAPDNRFNRNPLLKMGIGADGLKTGHTSEAGYGLVGSALQGQRRIVFVISGLASEEARAQEAEAIVNWAFRQFTMKTVVRAGTRVAEAGVWLGNNATVGLVAAEDVTLLVPVIQRDGLEADVTWTGPIAAPIVQGQELGRMVIRRDGMADTTVALVAETAVGEAGFVDRLRVAAERALVRVLGGGPAPLTN
jgi:D-alanyl-D-alanine carboxypeptidase (penicillin-binding protein 5/6)